MYENTLLNNYLIFLYKLITLIINLFVQIKNYTHQ